ncbi:MAG: hypothetical protein WAM42_22640, partial [Candidatus Nitrosopolaris sp.]
MVLLYTERLRNWIKRLRLVFVPVDIVTERDIITKVCINDVRTSTVTSKEIMSTPLIAIKT